MKKLITIAALFCFAVYACKKDEDLPDLGYAYFPDAVGTFVVYEVDSIAKDDLIGLDTAYKFLVKELIESVYNDNQNRPTLRIERYKKFYNPSLSYDSMNWTLTDVWAANKTSTSAERVEENVRYTRLVFPVKENKTWNGNAQNTFEEWNYKYSVTDEPAIINSLNFDSALTVTQINVQNLVDTKYSVEKYAKNVGMIYKQLILLNKQPSSQSDQPPFDDTVATAYFTMKLIQYGKE
jgi:hypothetical protein